MPMNCQQSETLKIFNTLEYVNIEEHIRTFLIFNENEREY